MKLLFTGDVCFHYKQDVDETNAAAIFAAMKPHFANADFRIMNMESPIFDEGVGTPITKSGPNLIGRPKNLAFLKEAECDCAVLANNHTGDFGSDAVVQTLSYIKDSGIGYCGAGYDIQDAYRPWFCKKDGVRCAIIAVCENEFGCALHDTPGSAGFDMERLSNAIRAAKPLSDFVVVVYHGGCEHNPLPSPLCRGRLRTFIRLGADAVIAGHTHCMQGYEYYDNKPIVYSMSNFYFPWRSPDRSWQHGYTVMLTLDKGAAPSISVHPYFTEENGEYIKPLTGEHCVNVLAYIDRLSRLLLDDDYMNRHYMGWCTISGIGYIKAMQANSDYFTIDTEPKSIAPLRNLLSCEAHNELCRTTLQLAFDGRMAEAASYQADIRALQIIPE